MRRLALSVPLLAAFAGCAIRTSDPQGRVTTVGLVWSTHEAPVPPHIEPSRTRLVFGPERLPDAPRWIELRAAGLVFERTPHDFGFTVGYKDSIWVFPITRGVTETESGGLSGGPARLTLSRPEHNAPAPLPP